MLCRKKSDPELEAVLKAIQSPQSYSIDGETVNQRSAADFIALLKYAKKTKITTRNAVSALGAFRISTPGTGEK